MGIACSRVVASTKTNLQLGAPATDFASGNLSLPYEMLGPVIGKYLLACQVSPPDKYG
jgi:hypothetical protein